LVTHSSSVINTKNTTNKNNTNENKQTYQQDINTNTTKGKQKIKQMKIKEHIIKQT
jgi:hypothetical protein